MRSWWTCLLLLASCTGVLAQSFDNGSMAPPATEGLSTPTKKTPTIKRGTTWFVRPQKDSAGSQLLYAQGLHLEGRLRAAYRAYNALVYAWPDSTQAVTAQVACAEVMEERRSYADAFDEYQYLIDRYAGQFDYNAVLDKQFGIANHLMTTRRGQFLFFPGFEAPERALPLFTQIVENAPSWDKAPQAQFNIGMIHEKAHDWSEANTAYEILQNRYETSPWAEPAGFHAAYCLYKESLDRPNDVNACNAARSGLVRFIRAYPNGSDVPEARDYLNALNTRYAGLVYERARYYDRIAHRPASALVAYRSFVKQFPDSEQAATAKVRIQELQKETKTHDAP